MTTHMNTDVLWFHGAQHVAAHAKSATFATECDVLDVSSMSGGGWQQVKAGMKRGMFDLSLMADHTDDGLDELLWSYHGLSTVSHSFAIGSTDGSIAYTCKAKSAQYVPIEGGPGALAMAKLSGVTNGPVARGQLLHGISTARTSSSTGTGFQVGAVSASQRMWASLHVVTVSGTTPSLTVKVQSDDNSGFTSATDRITFTAATDETYETSSAAGAITDDYWRISYTISGTNPSFLFAVCCGIA